MNPDTPFANQTVSGTSSTMNATSTPFEPLRRDAGQVVRAAGRALADIDALATYAQSAGAPGLLRAAARLARRKPVAFLGAALLLGFAALQALRRAPALAVAAVRSVAPGERFDESRLPRHDRPSGYFSARGEGALTNTPKGRAIR